MSPPSEKDRATYLSLSKAQIRNRLQASAIRQRLMQRLPAIHADKLECRIRGLVLNQPNYIAIAKAWLKALRAVRLQQQGPAIEAIESNYLEFLKSKNLEEFWYKPLVEGADIEMRHYDSLKRSFQMEGELHGKNK